jgi:hypothetical protein
MGDDAPVSSSYGPIDLRIELGGEAARGSGDGSGITVFDNAGAAITEDSYDVRGDVRSFGTQRLLGREIQLARVLLVDADRTMFDSTVLPLDPAFATQADAALVEIVLNGDPTSPPVMLSASGRPFTLARERPRCASTATTVADLKTEVNALTATQGVKLPLVTMLDAVSSAIDAGDLNGARRGMGAFMVGVIQKSTTPSIGFNRIRTDQAQGLICSSSNVYINIGAHD